MSVTFQNDTTLELRMSVADGDGGPPAGAVLPPGGRATVFFRPNPEHASPTHAVWTGGADCNNGDAPGYPAPGNYTIIARHYAHGDAAPHCGGAREIELVSPDASGATRP